MFAGGWGVPEDPATGSAVAAFAGVLMAFEPPGEGEHMLAIEQGFEMGRPSKISLGTKVESGKLVDATIGGYARIVCDGTHRRMSGRVFEAAELDFALGTYEWPFARERAEEIAEHWRRRRVEKPALYDGRVLLMSKLDIVERDDGEMKMSGAYFETAYSNFLTWRDFGSRRPPELVIVSPWPR